MCTSRRFASGGWLILPALLATVTACADAPTQPRAHPPVPAASVVHEWIAFTAEWSGCTEPLVVQGWQRSIVIENALPDGQTQLIFQYDKLGTAVGSVTGARYTFKENSHYITTSSGLGGTFTLPMMIHLIGQGDAIDMTIRGVMHTTLDAQGEVVSEVNEFDYDCGSPEAGG